MKNVGLARKIIAVDFDGTLCEDEFPKIGRAIKETIDRFHREKRNGSRMILYTCRAGDNLQEALDWCSEKGLEFDAVNENLQENIDIYGIDTRKVFAHEYWDDRNIRLPHLSHPDEEASELKSWAQREILLACERERSISDSDNPGDWDYGVACYESAHNTYKTLLEDGHSGLSISLTRQILNRLILGKPLTPIVDSDDIWELCYSHQKAGQDKNETYQCKRMSSLFKHVIIGVNGEETVSYRDIDSVVCVDVRGTTTYASGLVADIIHDLYPVTMPYYPLEEPIRVYCEDFLAFKGGGDYDTKGVYYAILPDGTKVDIDRFLMEDRNGDWVSITKDYYEARRELAEELMWEEVMEAEFNTSSHRKRRL